MTFADSVRECIRDSIVDQDRRFACLYGMLLFSKTMTDQEMVLKSESPVYRAVFPVLVKTVLGIGIPLEIVDKPRKNGSVLTIYRIRGEEAIATIQSLFHIEPTRRIDLQNLPHNSMGIFLGGTFLSCGSISDPHKDYHLEFATPTAELCEDLCDILHSVGVHPRRTQRKYAYSAYLKGSEEIGDLLTFIGAGRATLVLLDIKIDKEVKNKVNRMNNCDLANIDKVVTASAKQRADILLIAEHYGLDSLSPQLQEIAQLRLDNPDLSLQELGELLAKPIGRSGVNHRLRRLAELADRIRGWENA